MSAHNRGVKPAISPDMEALTRAPTAPSHMSKHAKAEWKRVMPQLIARRILTKADLSGVENYCSMIGVMREIDQARSEGPFDVKLFGVYNRAALAARQLASEYGLTPTSRARIGVNIPDDDEGDDPLAVQ